MNFHFIFIIHRQVKFKSSSSGAGTKRVAEEEIIEVEDLAKKQTKLNEIESKKVDIFKKPALSKKSLGIKSSLANLVRRKEPCTSTSTSSTSLTVDNSKSEGQNKTILETMNVPAKLNPALNQPTTAKTNALSLLSGYDDDSDSD